MRVLSVKCFHNTSHDTDWRQPCNIYLKLVRFCADYRIKPHAPPFLISSRQFLWVLILRSYSPGGALNALAASQKPWKVPTTSAHRLRSGLPGYLILFAPQTFAPQCQYWPRDLPSPLVFLLISAHSTATPGIPDSPTILKLARIECRSGVEPQIFTSDVTNHLRALYAQ